MMYKLIYMNEKEWSVIRIKVETKKKLEELKIHPRQSYNEVIEKLIKAVVEGD